MFKMKIVRFKDGKYGIRKYVFMMGYRYFDYFHKIWWTYDYFLKYRDDCVMDDLDHMIRIMKSIDDKGKIIKIKENLEIK